MPDIASIAAGVNAVKLALGIAKDLKDATAAYTDAEFRLKVSDLYINLSDARINLADAQDEIHGLHKKVRELQEKIDMADELEFRQFAYFRKVEEQGKSNGPFCPTCFESPQKRMSTMTAMAPEFSFAGRYRCNACGGKVQ
ncbi:hypothetical protein EEAAV_18880 [Rahnella aceris]